MNTTTPQEKPKPPARGIECPACACRHFYVVYTRRGAGGKLIRRRECRNCGRRITTWEHAIGAHPQQTCLDDA